MTILANRHVVIERYLVSSIVNAPALLDDQRVQTFEAIDLLDWISYRTFAIVRNLEARGRATDPAAVTARYEADQLEHQDGDRTGYQHHPELDDLIAIAARTPPSVRAVHRMIAIVRRDAAARRRLWRSLTEPDRFEVVLIEALLASVERLPPGRPEPRRRAA